MSQSTLRIAQPHARLHVVIDGRAICRHARVPDPMPEVDLFAEDAGERVWAERAPLRCRCCEYRLATHNDGKGATDGN